MLRARCHFRTDEDTVTVYIYIKRRDRNGHIRTIFATATRLCPEDVSPKMAARAPGGGVTTPDHRETSRLRGRFPVDRSTPFADRVLMSQ